MEELRLNQQAVNVPANAPARAGKAFVKPKHKKGWADQQRRKQQEEDDDWKAFQSGRWASEED